MATLKINLKKCSLGARHSCFGIRLCGKRVLVTTFCLGGVPGVEDRLADRWWPTPTFDVLLRVFLFSAAVFKTQKTVSA